MSITACHFLSWMISHPSGGALSPTDTGMQELTTAK
jgi:hypothetical protein